MNPIEYLAVLQGEASKSGFHSRLNAWVDEHSEVARVLADLHEREVNA